IQDGNAPCAPTDDGLANAEHGGTKNVRERPIRTAIAGLGRAGWDIHWRQLLKNHPAFKVVGVIEPLAERRAEAEAEIGCQSFASLDEFLKAPNAELVVLATPSGGHGPESLACLERGLHVVVDKPMCQGVREADAMMAAAARNRRILTCYHPYRFSPDFIAMREMVRSGRLGRVVEIKCNRSDFSRRNDWVMIKTKGGGQHNVWGSHSVDQCLQLAGSPPKDVFSDLQCTVTPGDADDHCKIIIRCKNNTIVDVEVSNCMAFPPQPEWMIAGTCGGLIKETGGLRVKWFDPREAPPIAIRTGAAPDRRYGNDDQLPWHEEVLPLPKGRGFAEFYDNVAAAIRNGAPLLVTPESVRETIEVLEKARLQNPQIWAGVE
ncbi:MAG: Gfo/Idh/MocA family oxidoreductase, partial [Kiritimatiellota bacterium]|nr:Gfo/Idh/MocA family oxidoreductase [Kiritimatiellota bacterium]